MNKNNISLEEVKQRYARIGLTVINIEDYKNAKTKLDCVDSEGYKVKMDSSNLKYIKSYRRFCKTNPYTLENIKLWVKLNDPDHELLSTEYKGTEEKLEWRMISRPDLPTFLTSWHMFQSGDRHPALKFVRSANGKRTKPETIRREVDRVLKEYNTDWVLDEGSEFHERFLAKKTLLNFTDSEGFKSQATYVFVTKQFTGEMVLFHPAYPEISLHNMELYTELYSQYTFVPNQQYDRFRSKYKFICDEHGEFINNFSTVYSYNTGCQKCIQERSYGESNPNWNPNLTDKERENRYNRSMIEEDYTKWRRKVLKRDKHTCQICGNKGNTAHHKDGFHWRIERRVDVTNGITLCSICHSDFHDQYGYYYCTEEQWNEYVQEMNESIQEAIALHNANKSKNINETEHQKE